MKLISWSISLIGYDTGSAGYATFKNNDLLLYSINKFWVEFCVNVEYNSIQDYNLKNEFIFFKFYDVTIHYIYVYFFSNI